jgi:predicted P-loop ATPase
MNRTEKITQMAIEAGFQVAPQTYHPDGADLQTWENLKKPRPQFTKDGDLKKQIVPFKSKYNTNTILESDPKYSTLSYDEHSDKILWQGNLLEDSDLEEIALDMEVRYRYTVAERPLFSAVVRVAKMNKIEPIKDYLNGLEWDNETRIRDVFSQVFHCQVPKGAEDLIQVISHKWFISCVARILEPGCKMDTCLVLVGSKGLGKSTALKILASERYFSDSLINISHKDSYELIHQSGTWIWELAEMHALQGKTADNSKQFLSSAKDRYRPSYGKNPVERARRTVFTASTNNFQFLSDGPERRFWPITIQEKIDSDYLIDNRDQLWAEAVHYYQCGEKWWLPEKLEPTLELYQTSFIIDDPWTIPVVEYLRQSLGQGRTTTEIMEHLEIPKASQHTGYARRVAQICRDNGYHRGFDVKTKQYLWKGGK